MGCHSKNVTSKFIDQPYTPDGSIVNIDGQCYIKTGNTGSMTSGVSAQPIPYSTSCDDCSNTSPVLQQFTSDFIPDPDDNTQMKSYSQYPVSTRDMLIDNGTITGSNQASLSMGPWTPEEIEILCDGSPYFGPSDRIESAGGGFMYREIQIKFNSPVTVLPGRYIVKACGIKYWWGFKGGDTALYDSGYDFDYRVRYDAGYGIKSPYPGPDGMTTMEKHKYWEDIRDTQRAMHEEAPRPKATPWAYPILYRDATLYYLSLIHI